MFIVGHVTKEGALAGPRVLEHMVDCVLYFEGQSDSRYRMIRAVKNRFGAVNELGVFGMTDKGLREVANPSAIFLSRYDEAIAGSIVMISREGTRPLLVEVQALVDDAHGQPRRVALGLEQNRLNMLLAVMHRHGGVQTSGQDVYVNVVGGLKSRKQALTWLSYWPVPRVCGVKHCHNNWLFWRGRTLWGNSPSPQWTGTLKRSH